MHSIARKSRKMLIYPAVISFGITILRCFVAGLALVSILMENCSSVLKYTIYILIIILLDQFDGDFFRMSSLNNHSFWRKRRRIIDSCADRLCIQAVCIPILLLDSSFLYLYIAITLKEILHAIPCVYAYIRFRALLEPRVFSKISTLCVGLIVVFYLHQIPQLAIVTLFVMFFCSAIAMFDYMKQAHF